MKRQNKEISDDMQRPLLAAFIAGATRIDSAGMSSSQDIDVYCPLLLMALQLINQVSRCHGALSSSFKIKLQAIIIFIVRIIESKRFYTSYDFKLNDIFGILESHLSRHRT